jgi:hypothetical protein
VFFYLAGRDLVFLCLHLHAAFPIYVVTIFCILPRVLFVLSFDIVEINKVNRCFLIVQVGYFAFGTHGAKLNIDPVAFSA